MSLLRRTGRVAATLTVEPLEARDVPSATMAIAQNLEPVSDFMAAVMFTDVFKESRPWLTSYYNTVTRQYAADPTHVLPLVLDARGWPTQLSQGTNSQGQLLRQQLDTLMLDHLSGHYPGGTYTAWWDGTGGVSWGGDVRVTQTGTTPDGHHFALLSDTPGNFGIDMHIGWMSSTDPIRNVHVWLPDYGGQSFVGQVWSPGASFSPFNPLFLQRLAPFQTLRFMQMEDTITSQVVHWSDRRPWDYATQTSGVGQFQNGVAPEYIVELANELGANVWVNVPHMAQADYVRGLATMLRDGLKPGEKIYLEWSNEVWNGAPGFVPYRWVQQQLALPQNAGLNFFQFVARQERQAFETWEQVFAGQTDRTVRVVAGFEQNPWYTAHLLQQMNGEFDAISTAAYFGPDPHMTAGYSASTTADQIVSDTQASIPEYLAFLQRHSNMAAQYSQALGRTIQYLAYEGGPNLTSGNTSYLAAMNAASNDPRMYGIYLSFLHGAQQAGLAMLVNYEFTERNRLDSPYGLFGSLNYLEQPLGDAPKYRALIDFMSGL